MGAVGGEIVRSGRHPLDRLGWAGRTVRQDRGAVGLGIVARRRPTRCHRNHARRGAEGRPDGVALAIAQAWIVGRIRDQNTVAAEAEIGGLHMLELSEKAGDHDEEGDYNGKLHHDQGFAGAHGPAPAGRRPRRGQDLGRLESGQHKGRIEPSQ